MFAPKLRPGDEIRVVSPATSLSYIAPDQPALAEARLASLGLRVSYAEHAAATELFDAGPVELRLTDLHAAFADPSVKGILTTLGCYNSSQLLPGLDVDLIRANPKVFCGFSDITTLGTAIWARTGLVTYYGPHFSTFAMRHGLEYTVELFVRCVMEDGPYTVPPAGHWSDDAWYLDQEARVFEPNPGYQVISAGEASGRLLGGHLPTFCLLFGSACAPDLDGAILFLEIDAEDQGVHLESYLRALINQPGFAGVRGIVFGRFQRQSQVDLDQLTKIVRRAPELDRMPIVAEANLGHTTPFFTFPIGGVGSISARDGAVILTITEH
jgi:muramoyltetrapeptide carboxypeptidase